MSKEIFIPFHKEMIDAIFDKGKCWTSRTKKYGEEGDWFELQRALPNDFGGVVQEGKFELTKIIQIPMGIIRDEGYKYEGFDSSCAFQKYMVKVIHLKWRDERLLYTHIFKGSE